MDISKSSNFERYAYDLVERDGVKLRSLWEKLEGEGMLDLSGTEYVRRVAETGLVSGTSTHADRVATIRRAWKDYGVMIDPHTAEILSRKPYIRQPLRHEPSLILTLQHRIRNNRRPHLLSRRSSRQIRRDLTRRTGRTPRRR